MVHRAIFLVNNLEGVEFTDNRNKIVLIGPAKLAPGVTYFMFRSIVNGFTVDNYAPDNSLFQTPTRWQNSRTWSCLLRAWCSYHINIKRVCMIKFQCNNYIIINNIYTKYLNLYLNIIFIICLLIYILFLLYIIICLYIYLYYCFIFTFNLLF